MKKEVLKALMHFSKSIFYVFLVQLTSMQFLLANHGNGQSLKDIRISIEIKRLTPVEIFEIIEQKTNFKFGYNRTVASLDKKVSGSFKGQSLETILTYVAKEAQLHFKRINSSISVSVNKHQPDNAEGAVDYIEELDRTINGIIRDSESGEPLIGATVHV